MRRSWASATLPDAAPGLAGFLGGPVAKLVAFTALVGFVVQFLYLRTMLQHMDPSKVIPDRVRTALDTLAEGLLVLDKDERIVLANRAFARTVGKTPAELQGSRVSELPWSVQIDGDGARSASLDGETSSYLPWAEAIDSGTPQTGVMLGFEADADDRRTTTS